MSKPSVLRQKQSRSFSISIDILHYSTLTKTRYHTYGYFNYPIDWHTNLYIFHSKESTKADCDVISLEPRGATITIDYLYNGKTPTVPTKGSSLLNIIFHTCQRYARDTDQARGFLLLLQFDSMPVLSYYLFFDSSTKTIDSYLTAS